MLAIINGDKKNAIKITEGTYDYVNQIFHLKNSIPEEQTKEMIDYICSLKDTIITSIEIQRRNHDWLDSYTDLNAKLSNVDKHIHHRYDEIAMILNIDIANVP